MSRENCVIEWRGGLNHAGMMGVMEKVLRGDLDGLKLAEMPNENGSFKLIVKNLDGMVVIGGMGVAYPGQPIRLDTSDEALKRADYTSYRVEQKKYWMDQASGVIHDAYIPEAVTIAVVNDKQHVMVYWMPDSVRPKEIVNDAVKFDKATRSLFGALGEWHANGYTHGRLSSGGNVRVTSGGRVVLTGWGECKDVEDVNLFRQELFEVLDVWLKLIPFEKDRTKAVNRYAEVMARAIIAYVGVVDNTMYDLKVSSINDSLVEEFKGRCGEDFFNVKDDLLGRLVRSMSYDFDLAA